MFIDCVLRNGLLLANDTTNFYFITFLNGCVRAQLFWNLHNTIV